MTTQDRANQMLRDELGGMKLALIQQAAEIECLSNEKASLQRRLDDATKALDLASQELQRADRTPTSD